MWMSVAPFLYMYFFPKQEVYKFVGCVHVDIMWYVLYAFGVLLVIQQFLLQVTGGLLPPSTGVKRMPGTAGVSQTKILSLRASCNPHE